MINSQYINILNDLKQNLKEEFADNLIDVILFGSKAQGNSNVYSDFDILIIFNSELNWKLEKKVSDICFDIELKYDIIMDNHMLSQNDLHRLRGKQPVFELALKNGIYA